MSTRCVDFTRGIIRDVVYTVRRFHRENRPFFSQGHFRHGSPPRHFICLRQVPVLHCCITSRYMEKCPSIMYTTCCVLPRCASSVYTYLGVPHRPPRSSEHASAYYCYIAALRLSGKRASLLSGESRLTHPGKKGGHGIRVILRIGT